MRERRPGAKLRFLKHSNRFTQQILLTKAGDEIALQLKFSARGEVIENGVAERFDTFACECRHVDLLGFKAKQGQIRFIGDEEEAALLAGFGDERSGFLRAWDSSVNNDDSEIGIRHGFVAAFDAEALNEFGGFTNSGGIHEA